RIPTAWSVSVRDADAARPRHRSSGSAAGTGPVGARGQEPGAPTRVGGSAGAETPCEQVLGELCTLRAVALRLAEQVGELGVAGLLRVGAVGLQSQGVGQALLREPDQVVVLVLRPGDPSTVVGVV